MPFLPFLIFWGISRKWGYRFMITHTFGELAKLLPLLVGIGLGLLYGWKYYFANATIILLLGKHWGNLVARFILTFFAVVIWPLVIRRFCADGTDEKERNNGT